MRVSTIVNIKRPLLGELRWHQKRAKSKHNDSNWQWVRQTTETRESGLMLNSDMSLYKEIGEVENRGKVSCVYDECPLSSVSSISLEYAEDNALWIRDFTDVWHKMVQNGEGKKQFVHFRPYNYAHKKNKK